MPTPTTTPRREHPAHRGRRAGAGLLIAALGATGLALAAPTAAANANSVPNAQSVGRFLDGAAGGSPLENLIDLKDARASNPGTATDRNPLDVRAFGQADVPLTGKLQGPSVLGIHLGAANQIAVARSTGYAYGAAGAIADSGGASLGGDNSAYPSDARIRLDGSSLGAAPVPVPGAPPADAFGGITARIGATSALAYTPTGYHRPGSTRYSIAGLGLTAGSPLLGRTLLQITQQLNSALQPVADTLARILPSPLTLPAACSLTSPALTTASFDGGAIRIADSTLHVDAAALLARAGVDINKLPANTDLTRLIGKYLAAGLAKGLQNVVLGLGNPLQRKFTACAQALNALPAPVSTVTGRLTSALTGGEQRVKSTIESIATRLSGAGGSDPFAPLADGLEQLLDIGVNVQPHGPSGSFSSGLRATPDQATPTVAGQTVVRALELKLGGGRLDLSLANAAAGPSNPSAAPPTTAPHHPDRFVPTAIPAGQGPRDTHPALPLQLVGLGLVVAGLAVLSARRAGRRSA